MDFKIIKNTSLILIKAANTSCKTLSFSLLISVLLLYPAYSIAGVGDRFINIVNTGVNKTKGVVKDGKEHLLSIQLENKQSPVICPTFQPEKIYQSDISSENTKTFYTGDPKSIKLSFAKKTLRESDWSRSIDRAVGDIQHERLVQKGLVLSSDSMNQRSHRILLEAESAFEKLLKILPKNVTQHQNFKLYLKASGKALETNALPNGNIYISESLMRQPILANFLLSREISHILKRHTGRAYKNSILNLVESNEDIDRINEMLKNHSANTELLEKYLNQINGHWVKYNIFHLQQADACATRIIAKINGVNPHLATKMFFESLKGNSGSDGSNHSDLTQRKKNISTVLSNLD